MEIIGKLIKVLPEQSGTSANGAWVRGGFVLEYQDGSYPRQAAFTLFGESRINSIKNIPMGAQVRAEFSVASREYQERWYTDLSCYRVEQYVQGAYQQPQPQYGQPYPPQGGGVYPQQFQQPVYQQPQQPVYPPQTPAYQPQPQAQPAAQPPVYPEPQPQSGTFGATPEPAPEDDLPF